jgi:hypothetical protein
MVFKYRLYFIIDTFDYIVCTMTFVAELVVMEPFTTFLLILTAPLPVPAK